MLPQTSPVTHFHILTRGWGDNTTDSGSHTHQEPHNEPQCTPANTPSRTKPWDCWHSRHPLTGGETRHSCAQAESGVGGLEGTHGWGRGGRWGMCVWSHAGSVTRWSEEGSTLGVEWRLSHPSRLQHHDGPQGRFGSWGGGLTVHRFSRHSAFRERHPPFINNWARVAEWPCGTTPTPPLPPLPVTNLFITPMDLLPSDDPARLSARRDAPSFTVKTQWQKGVGGLLNDSVPSNQQSQSLFLAASTVFARSLSLSLPGWCAAHSQAPPWEYDCSRDF